MAARVGLDRGRVVAAAARLVDGHGLAALTMTRLAADLGVRYQSLAPHVGYRRDLLGLLQERYLDGLQDVAGRAALGRSGRDALEAIARAHLEYDVEHPGLLAVHNSLGGPVAGADERGASGAIRAVLAHYRLGPDQTAHWLRILSSAMLGFSLIHHAGLLCEAPDQIETHRIVIGGLIDALETQT